MNMSACLMEHEAVLRLASFFGVFALVAAWEIWAPRRALTVSKSARWANNVGLVVLNTVVLRLLFPAAAVGMAAYATEHGLGLFNNLSAPVWLAVALSLASGAQYLWRARLLRDAADQTSAQRIS